MAMNGNEGGSAYPPNPDVKSGSCLIAGFQPLTVFCPSYWNAYKAESGATFSIDMVRLKLSFINGKKSKRWKPLLQASQKASERSGRLEAMEAEKMRLEARLRALEGELATSKARLRTATAEQKALSEGCQRCEQGIANLQNDLTMLEAE